MFVSSTSVLTQSMNVSACPFLPNRYTLWIRRSKIIYRAVRTEFDHFSQTEYANCLGMRYVMTPHFSIQVALIQHAGLISAQSFCQSVHMLRRIQKSHHRHLVISFDMHDGSVSSNAVVAHVSSSIHDEESLIYVKYTLEPSPILH